MFPEGGGGGEGVSLKMLTFISSKLSIIFIREVMSDPICFKWKKEKVRIQLMLGLLVIRNFVQVAIYRKLGIGPDSHLDQSEAYDIS